MDSAAEKAWAQAYAEAVKAGRLPYMCQARGCDGCIVCDKVSYIARFNALDELAQMSQEMGLYT